MQPRSEPRIRPEILAILRQLRRRIRWYVLAEGVALVLVVLAVLFWASISLDWLYFSLRRLELPVWFRQAFAVSTFALFAFVVTAWLLLRLVRPLQWKALALVLERRYPKLDDRLITAIELADSPAARQSPLAAAMLDRTMDDAARLARDLELRAVFNEGPLRRSVLAAVVLIASIGGFAWANEAAVERWARAYVRWDDAYWKRETELIPQVLAQPGDRIKPFVEREYKHPRGADLTLLVEVAADRKVPDDVTLYYRLADGRGRGSVLMNKFDDRHFRHTLSALLDGVELWVQGGDYVNREPYRVLAVDPPRVDRIVLFNDYPDYTGLDETAGDGSAIRDEQVVQGSQISLPLETHFSLQCFSNKPLRGARIRADDFELEVSAAGVSLSVMSADGLPQPAVAVTASEDTPIGLGADGMSFQVPFHLAARARETLARGNDQHAVPLPPDAMLQMYLEDTDEIIGHEPAQVMIAGIVDQPPSVESELRGIGTSITRKAVIPVRGTIADDYGLQTARFEFRLDDSPDWRPRPFRNPPPTRSAEFALQREKTDAFEQFEVLPLDLQVGQKLLLSIYAVDQDNLNGPHESRGEQYAFSVVSDEELLSILYSKELNLRRRFEQIIVEVQRTQQDLGQHQERAAEAARLKAAGTPSAEVRRQIDEIQVAVSVCAERSLHQIRKNASETAAVTESFGEILEELVNNGVHTSQMVERLSELILRPLHTINEIDYPKVDEALGLFRFANEKGADPVPRIEECRAALSEMLRRMRAVLTEMEELVEFHEAVKDLKTIIDEEAALNRETEALRKKRLIEGLRDLR